jgi:hypothetical protein
MIRRQQQLAGSANGTLSGNHFGSVWPCGLMMGDLDQLVQAAGDRSSRRIGGESRSGLFVYIAVFVPAQRLTIVLRRATLILNSEGAMGASG